MSKSLYLPEGYKPSLSLRETQHAIKYIKDVFQQALSFALTLDRVSAPLIVEKGNGINDDLNGVERKVDFTIKELDKEGEVVQSLAKWKRMALYRYGYEPGEGIYTDMNAILIRFLLISGTGKRLLLLNREILNFLRRQ